MWDNFYLLLYLSELLCENIWCPYKQNSRLLVCRVLHEICLWYTFPWAPYEAARDSGKGYQIWNPWTWPQLRSVTLGKSVNFSGFHFLCLVLWCQSQVEAYCCINLPQQPKIHIIYVALYFFNCQIFSSYNLVWFQPHWGILWHFSTFFLRFLLDLKPFI